MSTAARKARKRTGDKFTRTPKTGTPITERAWFNAIIPGPAGTRNANKRLPRSAKKRAAALAARGINPDSAA